MMWELPKHKEERVRRKFCWFPFEFNRKVYWLEFINIKEKFCDFPLISWWSIDEVNGEKFKHRNLENF